MGSSEVTHRSFIVRVWLEAPPDAERPREWRGYIRAVAFAEDCRPIYLHSLGDVELVIGSYLTSMGARLGPRWRLRHWRRRAALHAALRCR